MNSDNTPYMSDNGESIKSVALSVTCALILITMLLSSSDSFSWLLRITLVVWLSHVTLSQVCASMNFKFRKSTWFQDAKFSLGLLALELEHPPAPVDSKNHASTSTKVSKPDISSGMWEYTAVRKAALHLARALVFTSTLLMKIGGVRDNTLRGELTPSQFYQECWREDIMLRPTAKEQISFGFKCVVESFVFVYQDGYIKRVLRSNTNSFKRHIWEPLCKAFQPR